MKKLSVHVIPVFFILFLSFHCLSQSKFKDYLDAAYQKSELGQYQAAIDLLLKAEALKNTDTGNTGLVDLYLGSNYQSLQKTQESIIYYSKALDYYEPKDTDYAALSFLYNRLGYIEQNFIGQYLKAIGYYRKQMHYDLLELDSTSLFDCFNNIGIAYKELKQYDSALFYFHSVLNNYSLHNQSKRKALLLVGDTYSLLRKFDIALHYYDQAISQMSAANDSVEMFMVYANKGDCLLQQGQYQKSLFYLTKAQAFNNDLIRNNVKKDFYNTLAEAYSYTNDFRKAFKYKNLEGDIKDSINTEAIDQATARMEVIYETRKNKDSLQISKDSLQISQQTVALTKNESNDRQRKFTITLISAAVICLIAFLALRNATLRKKANTKLAAQKAKVEALAADLEEANQTKARLFSVISHDLRSPVSSLYASLKMQEVKGGTGEANRAVSSQIMHLLDTLEDLLTWSKSQMDRFTLQPVTLRIADMYADLIELHDDAATSKQITIVNKAEKHLKIYTDENLLKTILRNVLANSIHHAPNKSTVVADAVTHENGVVCTISNEATATDAAMLEARLQTAAIGSSKHGLGNVLIKEFTQKLQADFELTYADGKVYLQIKVPSMHNKQVNRLQPAG